MTKSVADQISTIIITLILINTTQLFKLVQYNVVKNAHENITRLSRTGHDPERVAGAGGAGSGGA
jgi:hypothetical protein